MNTNEYIYIYEYIYKKMNINVYIYIYILCFIYFYSSNQTSTRHFKRDLVYVLQNQKSNDNSIIRNTLSIIRTLLEAIFACGA